MTCFYSILFRFSSHGFRLKNQHCFEQAQNIIVSQIFHSYSSSRCLHYVPYVDDVSSPIQQLPYKKTVHRVSYSFYFLVHCYHGDRTSRITKQVSEAKAYQEISFGIKYQNGALLTQRTVASFLLVFPRPKLFPLAHSIFQFWRKLFDRIFLLIRVIWYTVLTTVRLFNIWKRRNKCRHSVRVP